MAIRTIRQYPDDILAKKCKEVKGGPTPRMQELITDMIQTMHESDGIGLAAPQLGILKRLFVVDVTGGEEEGKTYVCINPELLMEEGEQTAYEGCLSLPGYSGKVTRPMRVKIRALDENWEPRVIEADDLLARALMHEMDHLEGIMYTDEMIGELKRNEDLTEDDL